MRVHTLTNHLPDQHLHCVCVCAWKRERLTTKPQSRREVRKVFHSCSYLTFSHTHTHRERERVRERRSEKGRGRRDRKWVLSLFNIKEDLLLRRSVRPSGGGEGEQRQRERERERGREHGERNEMIAGRRDGWEEKWNSLDIVWFILKLAGLNLTRLILLFITFYQNFINNLLSFYVIYWSYWVWKTLF